MAGGLRYLEDRKCKQCDTVFRPRHESNYYCTKACWYDTIRGNQKGCKQCGAAFKGQYAQQIYCSVACKNLGITKDKSCVCAFCSKEFQRPNGKPRAYCSIPCANRAKAKGMVAKYEPLVGRVVNKGRSKNAYGYVVVRLADGRKGLEHRVAMEKHLGRPLEKGERVHHKNCDRSDNRLENLELWAHGTKDPAGARVIDVARDALRKLSDADRALVVSEFV